MQIDWWTLAIQTVNFLVLVWLLWRFLYRPVTDVIEKRKNLAEQAFTKAAKAEEEAEAARRRFEEDRARLAQERQAMLKERHKAFEAERREMLEDAHRESDEVLRSARMAVAEERQVAIAAMREQVVELAADLASTLLRKSGSVALGDVFLEKIETQFKSLPEEERERLKRDAAADGARLVVATATPLSEDDRDRWRKRLGVCLGGAAPTDFATDPELIGGAELRFPNAIVRFTWADQLEKAKGFLCRDEAPS